MKQFLHSFTLVWAHLGLWIGYMSADYNYDPYSLSNKYYYTWQKALELLLTLCAFLPYKPYKWLWLCFCLFMGVRLLWEYFAIQDYATASRPSIIFLLFITNCACVTVMMFIQLRHQWQRRH